MREIFLATLFPMLTLFSCIAVGFLARRARLLPDNAGTTMAKLETWIFVPALSFTTMLRYCTPATLGTHAQNLVFSAIGVALAIAISVLLARLFVKRGTQEHGIFLYALAFANSGYMGDPIVQALFGDAVLSYYKIYCLPVSLAIYTWGISRMVPAQGKGTLRRLLNPPTVALLLGIVAGLAGVGSAIPDFLISALDLLKSCMAPVAMLLAGFTIAAYPLGEMLSDRRVYAASLLRLVAIPTVIMAILFGLKALAALIPGVTVGNDVIFLTFFAVGTPLGLNTVVFPAAYGGDPKTGAGMTLVSHTLAILTIPLLYSLLSLLLGTPFGA